MRVTLSPILFFFTFYLEDICHMAKISIPFNISLLNLTPHFLHQLKQITDLQIFTSNKETFHPEGLFSNEIFGPVGSEIRSKRFAYIDIKLPVLHPILYKSLTQARKFYIEIMSGETYATFSYKEKDFIKSDPIEGETGFHFFMTYYPQLELKDSGTSRRQETIRLLEKYREKAIIDKIIVLPAGLRDVEFNDGRPTYDDINDYYKKLISLSNNISKNIIDLDPSLADKTRFRIQEAFNLLYENLSDRVEGKKKLFLGKWASRRIFNGTRNVITASSPSGRFLDDPANIGYNDAVVGLYQMMKSILPVSIYHIQNSFLKDVFDGPGLPAKLINKDTWQSEEVVIKPEVFDYFQSQEGIEKLITDFQHEDMMHKPVMIEDKYLSLTYTGPDKTFKLFRDIRELPENRNREDVYPTTYGEFFYSCLFDEFKKYYSIVTRYPISGVGSSPPCSIFVKTTTDGEKREELGDDWLPSGRVAVSWPVLQSGSMNSLSPPMSTLSDMGGDPKMLK